MRIRLTETKGNDMADKMNFKKLYDALLDRGYVKDNLIKDTIEWAFGKHSSGLSEESRIFLTLYFMGLDNGSICIPFEPDAICEFFPSDLLRVFYAGEECAEDCVKRIVGKGIADFRKCDCLYSTACSKQKDFDHKKPFVIYKNDSGDGREFLFPEKHFRAKSDIQEKIRELFSTGKLFEPSDEDIGSLNNEIGKLQREDDNHGFKLNNRQAEAVLRAEKGENLFITGGAGTGKTTAVFYLLYKVLKKYKKDHPEKDWILYLIAPTGKAKDRLGESIGNAFAGIKEDLEEIDKEVFEKIVNAPCFTIHSLLSVDPRKGGFKYDKEKQFEAESIFVVDEASMIDIGLFASLLNAIKAKGPRIFILGDENQLPSVEAG
ncbi:MAG TPA: hypothetical protein DCO86_05065, partial [Spirochaetaceae bacterium]|nr:hypothetical protein [Spirochaetaceae bacterium]